MSERVLRLRLPTHWTQFALCLSAWVCVRLRATALACLHSCASAYIHVCLRLHVCSCKPSTVKSNFRQYLSWQVSKNWVPTKEFLLGLGQPWEPDPWEGDDEAKERVLVAASQHINELVTKLHSNKDSSSRWFSPKCNEKLKKNRQDGIPKQTQRQKLFEMFLDGTWRAAKFLSRMLLWKFMITIHWT